MESAFTEQDVTAGAQLLRRQQSFSYSFWCSCYFVSSSRAKQQQRGAAAVATTALQSFSYSFCRRRSGSPLKGEHGPKSARLHSSHVDSLLDAAVGAGSPATAAEEKDREAKMLREVIALIATRSRSDAAL